MAKKFDASKVNTGKQDTGVATGEVFAQAEQGTAKRQQQGTASAAEQQQRAAEGRTQGRKGCKAPRINMAFTTENHQFIKVMARVTGKTMTEYLNLVVEKYREEHPEIYLQAKAIIDTVEGE